MRPEQPYKLRRVLRAYLQPIQLDPHPDGYLMANLALDGQRMALACILHE